MNVLLVFVGTIIIIANFGSAEKSPAYCIKKVLRAKDLYVNGVKTKKYETKILRVCCDGYTQYRRRCVPLCEELCINSVCVAPNTCSCKKGFAKLNDHRCAPVCDNCKYGFCVAPGVCVCYKGYVKDSLTGACGPVCSQPCINGYCSDPDFCTCNEGYKISRDNLYKCERNNTLTTTTEKSTFGTSTLAAEDDILTTEYADNFRSTFLEELHTETLRTAGKSSFYAKLSTPASSTSMDTSSLTPFESIIPPTKALRIPKRKSKALFQSMLFAELPTTEKIIEEVTKKSENKTSEWIKISDVPSTIARLDDEMYKMSTKMNSFEGSTNEKPGLVTQKPSKKMESISYDTASSKHSTMHQQPSENMQTTSEIILTSPFDESNEDMFSVATTLESVDYNENSNESNDIIQPLQSPTLVNEVKSSKFTLKDVLIVVYSLLAMLAIIGIYIVFWFICSCRRFHEKEYHIGKLEKKKGVVKYSVDRNDIMTAW